MQDEDFHSELDRYPKPIGMQQKFLNIIVCVVYAYINRILEPGCSVRVAGKYIHTSDFRKFRMSTPMVNQK